MLFNKLIRKEKMKMKWWNFKITFENYFPLNGESTFTKILTYATDDVEEVKKIVKQDIFDDTYLDISKIECLGESTEN